MDMTLYAQVIKAREEMLKALDEGTRSWTQTACVSVVFPEYNHISTNQACHYGLQTEYPHDDGKKNKPRGSLAVVSALMKPFEKEMLEEEEAMMYLDWLINRSPYASTFISKDVRECLYHHAVISDSFTPSNLMVAGLVASRRLWEYPLVARVFCDLVKVGVQEDLAFYLGHIAKGSFDRGGKFLWNGYRAGHCSIDTAAFAKDVLVNWLNHKPVKLNATYHDNYTYDGYHDMWGGKLKPSMEKWIHKNFPYKPADFKKVNPFAKDEVAVGCTYEHAIETMAEFQHKIFEYIKYNPQVEAT